MFWPRPPRSRSCSRKQKERVRKNALFITQRQLKRLTTTNGGDANPNHNSAGATDGNIPTADSANGGNPSDGGANASKRSRFSRRRYLPVSRSQQPVLRQASARFAASALSALPRRAG
jgi:hypothetical protein